MSICLSANSQLDHRKLRIWENSKKQFMLSFSIFCFLSFATETSDTKNLLGSSGILPFVLTSTSKVNVAKKADRSSLRESFNMEISLQSPKGVTKVTGGHLKLIRKKSMKERCQVNTLPETASYFHEVQYFFLTKKSKLFPRIGNSWSDPLKAYLEESQIYLHSFLRGPINDVPEILAQSALPKRVT